MKLRSCAHEAEIRQLLERGQWPQAAEPELRAHADACRSCGDLALVMGTLQRARAASAGSAQLPPAGVLWWRAQLRRRNAAVERMNRPLVGAQIFAFATTLILAAAFVVSQARHGARWLSWLASVAQSSAFDWPALDWKVLWPFAAGWIKPETSLLYLVPGLGLLALFGGVVVYLAMDKQ